MSDTQGELGQQLDSLRSDLSQLRSDMRDMVQLLVDTGRMEAVEFKDRLNDQVREKTDVAFDKGRMVADRLETTIEENPMTSVLTALGIGFLLGILTSR